MRIAIAGFQHETNTFAPNTADLDAFRKADSWPPLLTGRDVVEQTRGMNIPIAGAVEAAGDAQLVPLLWCSAEPCGFVTDAAFDWVLAQILDRLKQAGPVDGLYLDLHGAMVTQSHPDGEGALLRRLRTELGDSLPIGVSLDLHANLSPGFVEDVSVLTIFRTYPHLDMAETGARCMRALRDVAGGRKYVSAVRQVPLLIPLQAQFTGQGPARDLYADVIAQDRTPDAFIELALGFTASDVPDCGPSVVAQAPNADKANTLADAFHARVLDLAKQFDRQLIQPDAAVRLALASQGDKPVVLADVQDNPGAGGTSDTTGLLHALIDNAATGAVLGVICDPDAATRAHDAGPGATLDLNLGGASGGPGSDPVKARFRVLTLSDGCITYTGQMYGGGIAIIGPSCLLQLEHPTADIRVVVSTERIQCLDQALFRHFGVVLEETRIICVKSTVHYRADFDPISDRVINVAAPGLFDCTITPDRYRNLRPELCMQAEETT